MCWLGDSFSHRGTERTEGRPGRLSVIGHQCSGRGTKCFGVRSAGLGRSAKPELQTCSCSVGALPETAFGVPTYGCHVNDYAPQVVARTTGAGGTRRESGLPPRRRAPEVCHHISMIAISGVRERPAEAGNSQRFRDRSWLCRKRRSEYPLQWVREGPAKAGTPNSADSEAELPTLS